MDRYFQAFEDGDMDSMHCKDRVQGLGAQLRQLEEERDGLQRQSEQAELGAAGGMSLEDFERQFDEIMKKGAPASQRKHLIKVLVPRVVVFSREEIDVYFRAPVPSVRVTGVLAPQSSHLTDSKGRPDTHFSTPRTPRTQEEKSQRKRGPS